MEQFFNLHNFVTLLFLTLLQAVLGFDNLLYISIESKRAPREDRSRVRTMGIGVAIVLRIALLFLVISVIDFFRDPVVTLHLPRILDAKPSIHSLIVLAGGAFIIYTATREILHMMSLEGEQHAEGHTGQSAGSVIFWIVVMNVVFSFDSILSAIALTKVFWVMATAIVISGILMIKLADDVSEFLQRNRMYEVLGLFILFVVGIMLLSEGGHLAHLELFNYEITPMSKATFYFVITVLVLTDVVQARYRKKLQRARATKGEVRIPEVGTS